MKISIIVAQSLNNVIGLNNQLLWHLPADMKHFKNLTTNHHILMGRKTYESISKALPNRTNIVISKSMQNSKTIEPNLFVFDSIEKGIYFAKDNGESELFVIGGGEIYNSLFDLADNLYITEIEKKFEGDTYFPLIDKHKWNLVYKTFFLSDEKNKFNYSFLLYNKISNFDRR